VILEINFRKENKEPSLLNLKPAVKEELTLTILYFLLNLGHFPDKNA